jgi:CMP-N-acetylneuraminic acid synthetase/spore coat polysaccharide biosynthesis predicted glycosyltransferase SpsG
MKGVLILIPARGGSKAIPQKNRRMLGSNPLGGKPLIAYCLANAAALAEHLGRQNLEATIALSTDDAVLAEIARLMGAQVLDRPAHLAEDQSTIDEVAAQALAQLETEQPFQFCVTLQPTSPLLKPQSLCQAWQLFHTQDLETLLSVREERKLSWAERDGRLQPLYKARVNRQELPAVFAETGAFVFCQAQTLRTTASRFGPRVAAFPLPEEEALDIDTPADWLQAEAVLKRKKIALVTAGNERLGMGHVMRMLTLAMRLTAHHVRFYCSYADDLAMERVRSQNFPLRIHRCREELLQQLGEDGTQIVINDLLDTRLDYVRALKDLGCRVVHFEDTGDGAVEADLLFNALYEWSGSSKNAYYGYRYECLRDDIYLFPIRAEQRQDQGLLVLAFGGVDLHNATLSTLRCLDGLPFPPGWRLRIILGIGYRHEGALHEALKTLAIADRVEVVRDAPMMARHLHEADLLISGNGRMVYEAAALATPLAVLSQNERECHHNFAKICPGIAYLGSLLEWDQAAVREQLHALLWQPEKRAQLSQQLRPFARELRAGIERVVQLIEGVCL